MKQPDYVKFMVADAFKLRRMSIIGCKMTEYMIKMRDSNYMSILKDMDILDSDENSLEAVKTLDLMHPKLDTLHDGASHDQTAKIAANTINIGCINSIKHDLMADYSLYKTTFEDPAKTGMLNARPNIKKMMMKTG